MSGPRETTTTPAPPLSPQEEDLRRTRLAVAEALGFVFESYGMPRAAGRVLGWLTVCVPPEQSTRDLSDALGLAPSTISTTSRILQSWGVLERVSRPHDRKRYLRLRPGGWIEAMAREVDAWLLVKPSITHLHELLAGTPAEVHGRVDELYELILFIEREIPALLERFAASRRATPGAASHTIEPSADDASGR
jgi:DNA-binding transcriptional regulator GbsR (MarR family)